MDLRRGWVYVLTFAVDSPGALELISHIQLTWSVGRREWMDDDSLESMMQVSKNCEI